MYVCQHINLVMLKTCFQKDEDFEQDFANFRQAGTVHTRIHTRTHTHTIQLSSPLSYTPYSHTNIYVSLTDTHRHTHTHTHSHKHTRPVLPRSTLQMKQRSSPTWLPSKSLKASALDGSTEDR